MAQTPTIVPCLWFDGRVLEAAEFYISLFPDSHIDQILRSSVDTPGAKKGDPLLIDFTLAGKQHQALPAPKCPAQCRWRTAREC